MTNIWAKFGINGTPEKVDECSKSEIGYMLREYRMAFKADGKTTKVWAGRKKDEPK